ncbi:MAG: single-stranded DNA-binding protein [Parvibaculum sp.]|nr:single-stranded DNA-binding protein [Parvibaculum sp.]
MNSLNKATIMGNLGQDPETRVLPSGMCVANLRIATSYTRMDKDNERIEETEWHNVVCFGKRGELATEHLKKGMQVLIEGRISTRSWDDKNSGEKKYRTEIVCDNLVFISSSNKDKEPEAKTRPSW